MKRALLLMSLLAVDPYQESIRRWQQERLAKLTAEDGWLSVTGLFWLKPGSNRFGSAEGNDIVLSRGPARAGAFELENGKVTSGGREIKPDSDEFVSVSGLKLFVIKRADRYGIRMKDNESPRRRNFAGLAYFAVDRAYRVTAKWVAAPGKLPINNVLGQTEPMENPGYAVFHLKNKEFRLYPVLEEPGDKELFFIFKDETAGHETYPAGRFLYSELPKNGVLEIDFNRAYTPPCGFTPFATCPLPPAQNRLPVRIEAGEKQLKH